MKLFTIITILICTLFSNLDSQNKLDYLDVKNYAIGIYGATGLNSHSTDFKQLTGIPNCCNGFKSGSGIGLNIGLVFQYPITERFELDVRASILDLGADLISTQQIPIADLENSNSTGVAETEHLIAVNLNSVGINLGANYYPLQYLYVHGGFFGGYVITGEFDQEERLTKPTNRGVFKDTGTRKRNQIKGDIPELTQLSTFLNLGVGYSLMLNDRGTFIMVPELSINLGLNNINNQPWTLNQITFGIALMFNSLTRGYDNPINPVN